jgi:outer membrane protein OmpA-like peptidoglycan-associated protein
MDKSSFSDLKLKPCQKKQESLNHAFSVAGRVTRTPMLNTPRDPGLTGQAKLKTRSRGIVQNRDTVLDKAAFSFAAWPVKREACLTGVTRQMKKNPAFLGDLGALSEAGGSYIFFWVAGIARVSKLIPVSTLKGTCQSLPLRHVFMLILMTVLLWIIPNQVAGQNVSIQTGIINTDIHLGSKKQDIVAEFGTPDQIKSEGIVYAYNQYGMSLYFNEKDRVELIYLGRYFPGLLNGRAIMDITLGDAMQAFGGTDHVLRRAYTPSVKIQTRSTVETEFIETAPTVLPMEYRGMKVLYELFSHDMVMKYKYVVDNQGISLWFDHNRRLYATVIYAPSDMKPGLAPKADDCLIGLADTFEIIFFDFDKYVIQKEHILILEKYVHFLKEYPSTHLLIEGHTDSFGTEPYNIDLSEKRAKDVRDYFVGRGISSDRLRTVWHAFNKPIAPNVKEDGTDNPEGRALNRRAELRLKIGN